MKKLLVLSLVMAVASIASAGLVIDISATEVNPGDVVTVKVIQDAADAAGAGGVLSINYVGANAVALEGTKTFSMADFKGWQWSLNGIDDTVDGVVKATKIPALGAGTPGIGSALGMGAYEYTFGVSFEATESFDLVVSGNWDGADVAETAAITVVPEPMTMALLGLGGLFIRRRRA